MWVTLWVWVTLMQGHCLWDHVDQLMVCSHSGPASNLKVSTVSWLTVLKVICTVDPSVQSVSIFRGFSWKVFNHPKPFKGVSYKYLCAKIYCSYYQSILIRMWFFFVDVIYLFLYSSCLRLNCIKCNCARIFMSVVHGPMLKGQMHLKNFMPLLSKR